MTDRKKTEAVDRLMGQLKAKDELIRDALAYTACLRHRLDKTNVYKQASAACLHCGHEHQETIDRLRADVAMQEQIRKAEGADDA